MSMAKIIKISICGLLAGLVTACATTSTTGSRGSASDQAQYERTIPVCVGASDCALKMEAARNWVAAKTGYDMVVNTDDRIETGGWGMNTYPAVRIERAPIGGQSHWILIEMDCGLAEEGDRFGANTCPPYWPTAIDFNRTVSSAQ